MNINPKNSAAAMKNIERENYSTRLMAGLNSYLSNLNYNMAEGRCYEEERAIVVNYIILAKEAYRENEAETDLLFNNIIKESKDEIADLTSRSETNKSIEVDSLKRKIELIENLKEEYSVSPKVYVESDSVKLRKMVQSFIDEIKSVISGTVVEGGLLNFGRKYVSEYSYSSRLKICIPKGSSSEEIGVLIDGIKSNALRIERDNPSVKFNTIESDKKYIRIYLEYTYSKDIIDLDKAIANEARD